MAGCWLVNEAVLAMVVDNPGNRGMTRCHVCGQTVGDVDTIAGRLRLRLAERKMTVRDLSLSLTGRGTSYQNLRRWIGGTGEPSLSALREIADALGVDVVWLTCGPGDWWRR